MERIRSGKRLITIAFALVTIVIVMPSVLFAFGIRSGNAMENLLINPDAETGDT